MEEIIKSISDKISSYNIFNNLFPGIVFCSVLTKITRFSFSADNILENNFITEINKTYSAGYDVVTSYRDSKNYGDNWVSAGYSLQFMREAKYLNNPRMLLGTSCAVSGLSTLTR